MASTRSTAPLVDQSFKNRLKKREARVFNANKLIEYSAEQDHLNLNRFFAKWIKTIKDDEDISKFVDNISKNNSKTQEEEEPLVDENYDGPCLNDEFNEDDLKTMLNDFKDEKILHSKYLLKIFNKANEVMKNLPNINEITILGTHTRVNVVGDIHGQFMDLYTILDKHGLPSPHNIYVFNGDFVDRGPQQIEVFASLLYMLTLYNSKRCVYLNRGNHEDYGCSIRFGFKEEIMNKYCIYSKQIMTKVMQSFVLLPICTTITYPSQTSGHFSKVFIVHGGITCDTDLNVIRSLNREKFDILDGTVFDLYDSENTKMEREQIQDLLWSDPMTSFGCVSNKQRNIARKFGPDITEGFLKKYGFSMLIRSHECKFAGYEYTHDNKCLTVFSASNYCSGVNKGAICILRPRQDIEISQFVAIESDHSKRNEQIEKIEKKIIVNLKKLMYFNRNALLEAFAQQDEEKSGYLQLNTWINTLNEVMSTENVPWRKYRSKLAECDDEKGLVKYASSFENCYVSNTFSDKCKNINDALARYKDTLIALFHLMDFNHSGSIDLLEFAKACKIIFNDQKYVILLLISLVHGHCWLLFKTTEAIYA